MMLQLHYYPGTASMTPHIVLQEIGVPFELVLVDRMADAHKTPEYLKLNPNGLIPVLTDGDLVLYETAAICLHLCDQYPAARLAPALGSTERAHFYKWLVLAHQHVAGNPDQLFLPRTLARRWQRSRNRASESAGTTQGWCHARSTGR